MRSAVLAVLMASAALGANSSVRAQEGSGTGVGIIIGDPTGASVKHFLSPNWAVDGALGVALITKADIVAHGDIMWHVDFNSWSAGSLDGYLMAGPKLGIGGKHLRLGARGGGGLAFAFREPFDVFLEGALVLWLIKGVDLGGDLAIGGRYWF